MCQIFNPYIRIKIKNYRGKKNSCDVMFSLSDWDYLDQQDLTLYTNLHFAGVRTVLGVLHNAVLQEQAPENFVVLRDLMSQAYQALERFSQVIFKQCHTFSRETVNKLGVTLGIKLYAGQILYLIDFFSAHYAIVQKRRKVQLILLRILYKLRTPVEKYLVSIRYWELRNE